MKMLFDYWGIRKPQVQGGGEYSRKDLMQYYYDHFYDHAVSVYTWLTDLTLRHPSLPKTHCRNRNCHCKKPKAWEYWDHMRLRSQELINLDPNADLVCPNDRTGSGYPAGLRGGGDFVVPATNDHPDADGVLELLKYREPIVISTTATSGHVMLIRGAVVDHQNHVQWLILNDPYGTLAGQDSVYGSLNIQNPVGAGVGPDGNQPTDVAAVQDALRFLGYYTGPIHGVIVNSPTDLTIVAIRAFQSSNGITRNLGMIRSGDVTEIQINTQLRNRSSKSYSDSEHEKNEVTPTKPEDAERGKHVYYNSETEGKGEGNDGTLDFRKYNRILAFKKQPVQNTPIQVSGKLVVGQNIE